MNFYKTAVLALGLSTLALAANAQQNPYDQNPYGASDPSAYPDTSYDYSPSAPDQGPAVDVGFFYQELAPYGEWVRHPMYGWVWFPRTVGSAWRPYSVGRWVDSDYGWTWVSYEPFGWATYHYGRWALDRQIGWIWIPGAEWAPAWVSWQQGGGYVGWAPLPPQVGFQVGFGLRLGGIDLSLSLQPSLYSFVDEHQFLDSRVDRYVLPPARNITIYRNTTNITNYTFENNHIINRGIPRDRIEQVTHQKVPRMRVVESQTRASEVRADEVKIYRPPAATIRGVRVGEKNDAGIKPTPRAADAPKPRVEVAPRPQVPSPRVVERQVTTEQRQTVKDQQNQAKRLQDIQRQELKRAPDPVQVKALQTRHVEETKAQQDIHQRQEQQLQNRQQIERRAVEAAKPAPAQGNQGNGNQKPKPQPKKPAKPQAEAIPPPPPGSR